MNKSDDILEIEAGVTVSNGFGRIFSTVPIHFGKGVCFAFTVQGKVMIYMWETIVS